MFSRIRATLGSLFGGPAGPGRESDVAGDPHVANAREFGGKHAPGGDSATTTGAGPNEEFVGRVTGGDDLGEPETSGAEARAEGRN